MKLFVAVALVLLASGAQANFFTDLAHNISSTLHKVEAGVKETSQAFVPYAKDLGKQLLDQAKASGTSLLSNTLTSLVTNAFSHLFGRSDNAVATLKPDLEQLMSGAVEKLRTVFETAMDALHGVSHFVAKLDTDHNAIASLIEQIVTGFHSVADDWLSKLVTDGESLVAKVLGGKRGFTDLLSSVGQALSSAFGPAVEGVKTLVGNLGSTLKTTVTGLASALTDTVSQLGQKLTPHLQTLQGHAQTLLQHGTNALQALKDATADIFQQTLHNAQPALSGIAETLTSAGQVAAQHLANALGGGQ